MGNETIVFFNWIACALGGWICLCRLSKMSESRTKLAIRWQYVLWFTFFAISGWSFAFGAIPSVVQLMLTATVAAALFLGMPAWFAGLPGYAKKDLPA